MKNLNIDNNMHFETATENDTVRHYLLMVFFILLGRLRDKTYQLEGLVLDYAKDKVLSLPYKGSVQLPFSDLPTVSDTKYPVKDDLTEYENVCTKKVRVRLGFKMALVAAIWVAFAAYTHTPEVGMQRKQMSTVDALKIVLESIGAEASEEHHGLIFRTLKIMNYSMDRIVDTQYEGVDPFRFHHTTDIKTTTPIKRTEQLATTTIREAAKVANQFSEADGLSTCYTIHEHLHGIVRLKCTGYSIPTSDELEQITQGHRDENELDERSPATKMGAFRFVLNK